MFCESHIVLSPRLPFLLAEACCQGHFRRAVSKVNFLSPKTSANDFPVGLLYLTGSCAGQSFWAVPSGPTAAAAVGGYGIQDLCGLQGTLIVPMKVL